MSRITEGRAQRMTSEERLGALKKGALVYDGGKQAELLCGLIGALTMDEMRQAMDILAQTQDGGNAFAQAVWDSLWTQWGRVDPVECMHYLNETSGSKSRSDARHVMQGWLEADPDAALAWASAPKESRLDAAAAAMAMTWNSGGDSEVLKKAILARPPGDLAASDSLWDYFDLASLTAESPTAGQIYDELPPALREAAWAVTLRRLTYTDSQSAKEWLEQHAGDPGRNFQEANRLVFELAAKDPEGTANWAAGLPASRADESSHPAITAINRWLQSDPVAARAWIESLPDDSPWAGMR